jgi:TPR repeat protein
MHGTSMQLAGKLALVVGGVGLLCPACGQSPDLQAPQTASDVGRGGETDAPNGVCRTGAQLVAHLGCVDDELSVSPDAVEACRSGGETECDARCAQGETPACTSLALVHELALEATPNTAYAARLFDRACAAGDGAACNDLGVLHAKGLGFPVETERAEALYRVACDRGSVEGCANLAMARTWGTDAPEAVARAAGAVENACVSSRNARACSVLGVLRSRGSAMARDTKEGVAYLERACALGDMAACDGLGKAYLLGDGVSADDVTAMRLFRRACDAARADACTDLAAMYRMGRGAPRDPARADALFKQACAAGDAVACAGLGARLEPLERPPVERIGESVKRKL